MDSQSRFYRFLRWSEKYTKTDMVYLSRGGFWLVLEQVSGSFFALLLAVAFGHLASQDAYGNYKYVLSLAAIFGAFSLTGLSTAITRAVARDYEGSLKQGLRLSLRWSGGVILLSLATALYYLFVAKNAFLGIALLLVAFFLPFTNSFSLFNAFLLGKKQFARSSIYNIIGSFLSAAALIIVLFFTNRAILFVLTYFLTAALVSIAFYLLAKKQVRNDATDPKTFTYGTHLSIMTFVATLADRIDSIVVFTLLGPASLAVYAYAIAIPEQIKTLAKNAASLSLPKFAARPIGEIRASLWRRLSILTLGITIVSVLYIFAAPYLFKVLFPVYTSAVSYSQWYAPIIILTGITAILTSVLQAHQKTRALYLITNIGSLVLIVSVGPLVYFYGVAGAIAAQGLFRATSALLSLWQFAKLAD